MAFPRPENSRGQINRAGEILRAYAQSTEAVPIEQLDEWNWAYEVLANWRACHNYPINTFQATLGSRLKTIDERATVAQRLKRFPSIVLKLQRFEGMQLARMQDIAVETMGTFLGQALKSGQGEGQWRSFFAVTGSAIAHLEKSRPVPGYETLSKTDTFERVAESEARLRVLEKLRGFSIVAEKITTEKGQGSFHLIVLNSADKSVSIRPYGITRLEQANADYAEVEKQAQSGEPVEAVLVSAGPVEALKKAYPNYFLDTHEFITQIERVIEEAQRSASAGVKRHRKPVVPR